MTTFMKTKFKKSDYQTNIDKYRLAANIYHYSQIHEDNAIFSCKNVKNQHIRNGRMDLSSCYIVPNCIRNHHTECEIDMTISEFAL